MMPQSTALNECNEKLKDVKNVDLDHSGVFKYILVKLIDKETKEHKFCVRGYARCDYHADIYDVFTHHLNQMKLRSVTHDCVGGGRIKRSDNEIFVYGYSQGFGRADHSLSTDILKKEFPGYNITWSNDGY